MQASRRERAGESRAPAGPAFAGAVCLLLAACAGSKLENGDDGAPAKSPSPMTLATEDSWSDAPLAAPDSRSTASVLVDAYSVVVGSTRETHALALLLAITDESGTTHFASRALRFDIPPGEGMRRIRPTPTDHGPPSPLRARVPIERTVEFPLGSCRFAVAALHAHLDSRGDPGLSPRRDFAISAAALPLSDRITLVVGSSSLPGLGLEADIVVEASMAECR